MESSTKIKILLTDDHKIMRDGLKVLFNNHPRMTIIGEADNLETTRQLAHQLRPDIITVGMNIDGVNHIDIVTKLAKEFPDIRIVAHSAYTENSFVSEILKAGTCAYVHKEEAFSELVKAIENALLGNVYLCPRIAKTLMGGYIQELTHNSFLSQTPLTEREREVLRLIADGKSSKETGLALHISTKTVDTHRRQIMNKTHKYTIPELTKYAIRCGLSTIN